MMKHFFKNETQHDLDQVVFAQRNKEYGAYALRTEYDQILSKSLMIGVALFASIAMVPLAVNALKSEPVKTPGIGAGHVMIIPPDHVVPPKPTVQPTSVKVKTVNTTLPTPTRHVVNQKTVPTVKEKDGAAIGPETIDGPETALPSVPTVPVYPTSGRVPSVPVTPPTVIVDPNAIPVNVDVAASFKGGIDAFRDRVGQSFDTSAVDQSGIVKAMVTFIVEKDGSITSVKATGENADFNREAERTVKSIKTKWNPAKLEGQIVRSYFKIPITMRIE